MPPPPHTHTGTLLGGITFRDVLVRYDRGARRVGFGHAACRALGQQQRPPCPALEREGILAVSGGGRAAAGLYWLAVLAGSSGGMGRLGKAVSPCSPLQHGLLL